MCTPDYADVPAPFDRRDLLGSAALAALALGACKPQEEPGTAGPTTGRKYALGRSLKAAFVNVGLANSWPAQGKAASEQWAKWLGIDVTWYDGGLSIEKRRRPDRHQRNRRWRGLHGRPFVAVGRDRA